PREEPSAAESGFGGKGVEVRPGASPLNHSRRGRRPCVNGEEMAAAAGRPRRSNQSGTAKQPSPLSGRGFFVSAGTGH
ncbi:MAG: hypothetical protein QHH02_08650, partial [Syntrophomonadaceae bacterium]|nr:hypothetical protein [Syntrophomonadaceae bacterium]